MGFARKTSDVISVRFTAAQNDEFQEELHHQLHEFSNIYA